ncbi:aldehyde dehydrogenase family protein [Jhaorihella thermophila]
MRRIADEIESRGAAITAQGQKETGLPAARLEGERGRTTGQLRLFADHIEKGDYLDRRHDPRAARPPAAAAPRPAVDAAPRGAGRRFFGASNFPLAFSTAGGDTASALAAGCPVVVKGHPAHPGVSDLVAQAIDAARRVCGLHPGVFSQILGQSHGVGQALVQHPLIRAVGFTGSLAGGGRFFDLCAARPEPIPFFGELGSVNPVFVLDHALARRGGEIAEGWAASLSLGAGQFCANPGIVMLREGPQAEAFMEAARAALAAVGVQAMLTSAIAEAFARGRDRLAAGGGVREVLTSVCNRRGAAPCVFVTTGAEWLANAELGEEVFGPLGIVVLVRDGEERLAVARALQGQLTCTLQMDEEDTAEAQALMPILERKAGRVLANGFPTGVEVADAMVHGGRIRPRPISAIPRWVRWPSAAG